MKKVIPEDSVLVPDNAERVFKGMIFDVYQWPQALFDGPQHTFEMLKRPDTVHAVCVVDDKILMLDDEQPHLGRKKTFPGGRVDSTDDSIQAAAQREVLEETGYQFKNWRLIAVHQPFAKFEWFTYLLLAWDVLDKQSPHLDPGEKISLSELSLAEVKLLIAKREGHLGESADIFEDVQTVDELLAIPEFIGEEVER